jgi:polysaccharide pyruvyl transferase WcaK-like protein
MRSIVQEALAAGFRVVVFPTATRSGTSATHNNDLPLLAGLQEQLAQEDPTRLHWALGVASYADISTIVRGTEALVVSRFHAMVAGLSEGVPCLVIGWGHKYRDTMEDFGLERFCNDADASSRWATRQVLEDLTTRRHVLAEGIRERLPAVRAASRAQLRLLIEPD